MISSHDDLPKSSENVQSWVDMRRPYCHASQMDSSEKVSSAAIIVLVGARLIEMLQTWFWEPANEWS